MSQLRKKLPVLIVLGVLSMVWLVIVTATLLLAYQHDTDPEAFGVTLQRLGVTRAATFETPSLSIPLPKGGGENVKVKVSYYWPPLGGTNCSQFVNGECISRMASGEPWQEWVDKAIACAPQYPFGTIFVIEGRVWICKDRGGAIQQITQYIQGKLFNVVWVDQLIEEPTVPFGTVVDAKVYLPNDAQPREIIPSLKLSLVANPPASFIIGGQNLLQKSLTAYLIFLGLVPEDLIGFDLAASDSEIPSGEAPKPDCDDPQVPCLFPVEGGYESMVLGNSVNGGLGCHTSGGPNTIKGWDYWKLHKTGGALVFASMDGTVEFSGYDAMGNTVIQISNSTYLLTYMHMKDIYVQSGQQVTQGQSIGTVGDVGDSDFPHLHFGIFSKGTGPVCEQASFFGK